MKNYENVEVGQKSLRTKSEGVGVGRFMPRLRERRDL